MENIDYEFRRILQQRDVGKLNRMLAEFEFDIGMVDGGSTTALHLASEYGNEVLVRVLIEKASDHAAEALVFKRDKRDRDTAIHLAALGGKVSVLEVLLEFLPAQVNLNVENKYKRTPLHYAIGKGNVEFARRLIEHHGARLSDYDRTGTNCFHFAARGGHVEALELVKEVAVSLDVDETTESGLTALHYAAWNNKVEAVKWLVDAGAELGKADKVEGGMPIHWAAMNGSVEAVTSLVTAHVKISMQVFSRMKRNKATILELMEQQSRQQIISVLKAADENELLEPKSFPETVLVKYVIGYGNERMNRKLETSLAYGMEKVAAYRHGILNLLTEKRLLDWAARKGNVNSIQLVMRLAEAYLRGEHEHEHVASALYIALSHGNVEFASALARHKHCNAVLSMKAYMLTGEFKDKPLAYRIFHEGKQDHFRKFFQVHNKQGWSWVDVVNEADTGRFRRTALHWAVILKNREIVSALCSTKECSANTMDATGNTPYSYAMKARKDGGGLEDAIASDVARHEDVKAYIDILYTDRQVYVDALNSILVAAALVAGITFAAFLQPPLGYSFEYRSIEYVRINRPGIQVFWLFNSLSFFFAIASSLAAVRGILPVPQLLINDVGRRTLILASAFVVFSIVSALIAFGAMGFSVIPLPIRYSLSMIVTASMGGILCSVVLVWFLRGLWRAITSRQLSQSASKLRPSIESIMKNKKVAKTKRYNQYPVGGYYPVWPFLNDGLDALCERRQDEVASDTSDSDAGLAQERSRFLHIVHSETDHVTSV